MLRFLAAALITLAVPAQAWAYAVSMTGGKVVKWATPNLTFSLNPAGSADLNPAVCLEEVRKSFKTWVGPACSALTFTEAQMSTNLKLTSVGYNANGLNEVAWIEGPDWTFGKYVLGVTSPMFYTSGKDTGVITEADIALNGYSQKWDTSGKAYSTDVMNVCVHEIGHFFGLQHNLSPSKSAPETMAPTADPFMGSRTPEQDDWDGLCFLYPKSGGFSCSASAQCPKILDDGPNGEVYTGQISCTSGFCGGPPTSVPQGTGKIGDSCSSDSDCATPLFCQPTSGSQAVCSQACNPSQSGGCPNGFTCAAYQGSSTEGACLAGSGGGGGKDVGQPCAGSGECKSKLCVNSGGAATCQTPCTSEAQCPAGQVCQMFAGKTYGACGDAPTGGGGTTLSPDGSNCASSSQCASGLCVGSGNVGTCLSDCTAKSCPAGFACLSLTSGKSACFKAGSKGLGETCADDLDCQGGLCAPSNGKYICSQPCSTQKPCPGGYDCFAVSGGGACFPAQPKQGIGGACQGGTDCQSGLCIAGDNGKGTCSQPCTKDANCGAGWACASLTGGGGACIQLGTAKTGATCNDNFDCASGHCVDFGKGFVCATPCAGAVDCACGEACKKFVNDSWCAAGPKVACVPLSGACAAGAECSDGLCLAGKCAPSCSIFGGGAACLPGKGCVRITPDKPVGTCVNKGAGPDGSACGNDSQCQSLFCDGGKCGKACNPFGPSTCAAGLVCVGLGDAVGACRKPETPSQPDAGSTASDSGSGSPDAGSTASGDDAATSASAETALAGGDSAAVNGTSGGNAGKTATAGNSSSSGLCSANPRGRGADWLLSLLLLPLAVIARRRFC